MRNIYRAAAFITLCSTVALTACGGQQTATPNPGSAEQTLSNAVAGSSSNPLTATSYKQLDRLNRPAVNEVFATFGDHDENNRDLPNDDLKILNGDIVQFMEGTAHRSQAISKVVASVLTPDVQIVDLSGQSSSCLDYKPGTCNNYLGIETGGATQIPKYKPFGGRALTDDIVAISLSVIFGNTIPALGLAPDDNNELDGRADPRYSSGHRPNLTNDNVSYTQDNDYTTSFPYLGAPK
ncbi:MAG: DUF4331 domain-containing protein [Candidatus Eremiobacteraeota bacterium]|nr:DUF4331 domain-containing protein [Candidatus Eremiobacteraeota bacterium]